MQKEKIRCVYVLILVRTEKKGREISRWYDGREQAHVEIEKSSKIEEDDELTNFIVLSS